MDVIGLVKSKLEVLLNNKFTINGNEKNITSIIEKVVKDVLLNMNNTDGLVVYEKTGRTFEDVEIIDDDELYKIDINLHDTDKVISLPSLMSISRIKDFLTNNKNHIVYIFVDYKIISDELTIWDIHVQTIESLDWSYLSIQNLGKGQLQMKNVMELSFNDNVTRREWLNILKQKGSIYYNNLLLKITEYKTNWEDEYLGN